MSVVLTLIEAVGVLLAWIALRTFHRRRALARATDLSRELSESLPDSLAWFSATPGVDRAELHVWADGVLGHRGIYRAGDDGLNVEEPEDDGGGIGDVRSAERPTFVAPNLIVFPILAGTEKVMHLVLRLHRGLRRRPRALTMLRAGQAVPRFGTALGRGITVGELEMAALSCGLTGLANRMRFTGEVKRLLAAGDALAVVTVGIVGFRRISNTFGYDIANQLVVAVSRILEDDLTDGVRLVARLEEDTFALLLEGEMVPRAEALAQKVASVLSGPVKLTSMSVELRVRAGVGISDASLRAEEGPTLLRWAEMALTRAADTISGHAVYDADVDRALRRRLLLMGEVRQALDHEDFEMWFQPKLELASGRVVGAEALIRWQHRELGFIPPDEFISLAESAGMISEISEQVVEMVVAARRKLTLVHPAAASLEIALNLSPTDLLDVGLPARLQRRVEAAGLPTAMLGVEVTEEAVMTEWDMVIGVLSDLAERGFPIYLDDFGTGYSSLSYLRRLPATALKIDRSFVQHLAGDASDLTIVRSTIDLAHDLGMEVVAEGVEDQESYDLLREFHCDLAQGFHMGRPMPLDDFGAWLGDADRLRALLGHETSAPVEPEGTVTPVEGVLQDPVSPGRRI